MPKLAVLASGRGSNLKALIKANLRGDLTLPVSLVICNNSDAQCLKTARKHGIPGLHISRKTRNYVDLAILAALIDYDIFAVALAGYMRPVGPRVLQHFAGKIVNIHPGPLPQLGGKGMTGEHVHRKALELGLSHSGPSVHLVTANYDEGHVLAHTPVAILPDDSHETLAARVLVAEHDLYWRTIQDNFFE